MRQELQIAASVPLLLLSLAAPRHHLSRRYRGPNWGRYQGSCYFKYLIKYILVDDKDYRQWLAFCRFGYPCTIATSLWDTDGALRHVPQTETEGWVTHLKSLTRVFAPLAFIIKRREVEGVGLGSRNRIITEVIEICHKYLFHGQTLTVLGGPATRSTLQCWGEIPPLCKWKIHTINDIRFNR